MSDTQNLIATIQKNSKETIRVTRENFKGHDLVQARVWALKDDGAVIPTKAGLAVRVEQVPDLVAALQKAGAA